MDTWVPHAKRSRAHRTAVILRVFVLMESVFVRTDSRIRRAVNRSEISDTVAHHINVRIYSSSLSLVTHLLILHAHSKVRDMELVIFVNAAVRVISAGEDLRATLMYVRVRP